MTDFTLTTIQPQAAAVLEAEVPVDELPGVFDRAFTEVARVVAGQGASIAGPPFGFYPRMPGETVAVAAGFPVTAAIRAEGDIVPFELPGGRAVTGLHVGSYDALQRTYDELVAWADAEGLVLGEGVWESYLSDPGAEPDPSTWRTGLVWPLAPSGNG